LYSPIIHILCFSQTLIHGISDHKERVSTVEQLKWVVAPFPCRTTQVGCNPISFDASSITTHANPLVKGSVRFLVVFIYSTTITYVCLKCLTILIHRFTCVVYFKFFFVLPKIMITLSLSQCKRIAGTGLFTIGMSISNSCSHSASLVVVSSATSYASIVDFVRIVCLRDLHETTAPPIVNMYPLVALTHQHLRSNLCRYTLLLHLGTQYSEVHMLWYLLNISLHILVHISEHFQGLK
jgi:hypothetical protein